MVFGAFSASYILIFDFHDAPQLHTFCIFFSPNVCAVCIACWLLLYTVFARQVGRLINI